MSYYTDHGEVLYQIRLNVTNDFTIDENLTSLLETHEASLICQYDAFVNFVKECESKDDTDNALYRWTKETINDEIKKTKLNVLCKGFSPVNVSKEMPKNKINQKKLFAVEKKYNKSVAFVDDSGCILIKIKNINENFIQKISEKLKLEKKWFNKLNKGMETFDITCQK